MKHFFNSFDDLSVVNGALNKFVRLRPHARHIVLAHKLGKVTARGNALDPCESHKRVVERRVFIAVSAALGALRGRMDPNYFDVLKMQPAKEPYQRLRRVKEKMRGRMSVFPTRRIADCVITSRVRRGDNKLGFRTDSAKSEKVIKGLHRLRHMLKRVEH